ncbi:hypothetical protein EVAR_10479_1 [Eumeta japonica]|uniref:Uncharacterized protein n=1 Tax=Eumeta variegata TaxID=151549 RepID=A0A4C1TKR8_EUMVA|nr:hypothetical protein EVAR_10479_1 [Eumeta japonica]
MGSKWRKCDIIGKVLTERHEIQMWRLKYLRKKNAYLTQGWPIIHCDESYVLPSHVRRQTNENSSFLRKIGTSARCVVHADCTHAFIEIASLGRYSAQITQVFIEQAALDRLLSDLSDFGSPWKPLSLAIHLRLRRTRRATPGGNRPHTQQYAPFYLPCWNGDQGAAPGRLMSLEHDARGLARLVRSGAACRQTGRDNLSTD